MNPKLLAPEPVNPELVAPEPVDPWAAVVGQPSAVRLMRRAVESPVHAYLFTGPPGSGKRKAAARFAAELLIAASPEGAERTRALAWREEHPDILVIDPVGNQLRRDEEAERMVVEASRSPVEGARKVLVINRFHSATPAAAAALLKTIEEPPASSFFVLLAENIPPEHVTIASRCTQIEFASIPDELVAATLASEGLVSGEAGRLVALAARGNLDRARLLANDDRVAARHEAWWSIPERLDGSGAAVAELVEELRQLIGEAAKPLMARQRAEQAELARREEQLGSSGSRRREFEARQRRELRQFRTSELRFGLATLAARYRAVLDSAELVAVPGDDSAGDPAGALAALDRLRATAESFIRNPNESLALQALLVDLPLLRADGAGSGGGSAR